MSIQVDQLLKLYGTQRAVDQVSFTAPKGSITGFLGPNGAGKSTTMKIITGYLQPDGGSATVCGIPVAQQPLEARRKIGYLPESNALYPDMYVREYLAYTGEMYGIKNGKERIETVLQQVGLQTEAHKKIGQLSKGYKQRVGLAAAIIHDPEVLILDEPTSGLDPNQIVEIRRVIQELSHNKTVLLSTHIMQEVEAICNQVIIISKGRIVANDSMENLTQRQQQPLIRVQFQEVLEAEWLRRLPSVQGVEKIDAHTWELAAADTAEARKELMQLALQQNLNIQSLQQGGSLEELFRKLTTQAATAEDRGE
ncbi:MAG: gliding motility-associated ABC transporter ATP-binding subunit GldA [Chitinophagaceae bacterium]|nr:gliding motility-associated ABC transporter ATP-binding subunit GldA [Chitinophagaceae bacterium]